MDAAILVLMHPETEARARELAAAYRVLDRLELWLADRRAKAQAREEAERNCPGRAKRRPGRRRGGSS